MSKKLIAPISGALCVLALTFLSSMASAGEIIGHCSSGGTCTGTFTGGPTVLQDDSGGAAGRFSCSTVTGTVSGMSNTSTATASLTLHGCQEPIFGTKCSSSGEPLGTIRTGNGVVSHLVYIDGKPNPIVGVLATNLSVTFSCPSVFTQKTVTGNVIAKIENPECGKPRTSFSGEFAQAGPGIQQYSQVTTTGTVFTLTAGNHGADLTQSSITGTGTITINEGKTVTLTC